MMQIARALGVVLLPVLGSLLIPGPQAVQARDLHLLAIRVDFQPDELETTTGNGLFESAFQFDKPWAIDPLPHDQDYFQDHLSFLANYYDEVSGGDLRLTAEVWPQHADSVYHLPKQMWQYNWNKDRETTDDQLIQLFRDSWSVADADPDLNFSDFDAFIVFHAGVGQDFGGDSTPHDIPSAWIGPADLDQDLLLVSDGIDGFSTSITNGLLLPESENHEGFQHGLAGTIVLQFAHVLGLPNLYNGQDGSSVIGKWGLMDQGSANFSGLLPALPSAWCRLNQGWANAVVLDHDTTGVQIAPLGHENGAPHVYKIPMGPEEYLLLEYRQRSLTNDTLVVAHDRLGRIAHLDSHFRITFPGDTTGVLVDVDNYDFDLPGDGILIWHVDERRTTQEYIDQNAVNDLPDPLGNYEFSGVDLEEGDGVQDIGQPYTLLDARRPVRLGSNRDPWFRGNSDFLRINAHLDSVAFHSDSEPSSRSNDGILSGVNIHHFSSRGSGENPQDLDSLFFDLSFDFRSALNGTQVCPPTESAECRVFDLENEVTLLTVLHEDGTLYGSVLAGDSLELYALSTPSIYFSPLPGTHSEQVRALFLEQRSGESQALWTLLGDQLRRFAYNGSRFEYDRSVTPGPGAIDSVLLFQPSGRVVYRSLGRIYSLDLNDQTSRELLADPALSFRVTNSVIDGASLAMAVDNDYHGQHLNAGSELIGLGEEGRILIRDDHGFRLMAGDVLVSSVNVANSGVIPLQAGDDSSLEFLLLAYDGSLRTYNGNGVEIARSNRTFQNVQAVFTGSWLGNDGEAICIQDANAIWKLDPDGAADPLWPRGIPSLVAPLAISPRLGQFAGVDQQGRIVTRDGAPGDVIWTHWNGTANGTAVVTDLGVVSEELRREQIENPVYIWPNPAGVTAHLRVDLSGPSQVKLRVYDMAGDLKMSMDSRVEARGYNDISWDTRKLENGAYFCAVEILPDSGSPHSETVKLAVIR